MSMNQFLSKMSIFTAWWRHGVVNKTPVMALSEETQRSLMAFPHKGLSMRSFFFNFFFPSPIKLLIQQSYCRWFDMSRRSCDVSVMGSTCCCRNKRAKIKPSVRVGYQKDQWCEKHPFVKPPSCCLCTGCRVWLRQIYIGETNNVNWVQCYICSWNIALTWF